MSKAYDRAYFERWYRARGRVVDPADVRRSARLALASAEHVLQREARTALDVGCGEGAWRAALRRVRPSLRYTGVDPSPWAIARHGRRRDIRSGTFGELGSVRLRARYDLVVCVDVLHYLDDDEVRRGLPALAARVGGIAWIHAFAAGDAFDGDVEGWRPRPAAWYRRALRAAGLVEIGLSCWTTEEVAADALTALERP